MKIKRLTHCWTLFNLNVFVVLSICFLISAHAAAQTDLVEKPRLLVLTDIGGDPDDIQSMRRLLVYANEFTIEGLVATATWGPKGKRVPGVYYVNDHLILNAISDYEEVRDNLLLHHPDYPTADELRAVVSCGQPNRGVENLAPGRSTAGSNLIIKAVDKSEEPLNIAIWGGAHDLAQALLDVRSSRTESEISEFISKIRVYAIGDQDKKYTPYGTGEWIMENFPQLFYIYAGAVERYSAGYRGIFQNDSKDGGHPELPLVKPGIEKLNDTEWVRKNIVPFGELGANYRMHSPKCLLLFRESFFPPLRQQI